MITLLSLFWLALCYNTTTMTQKLVVVQENPLISSELLLTQKPNLSIYDYVVEERWDYLCAKKRWIEQN